ncbi:hypothetical protein EDD21DRAFT_389125 [Dissophora ornata]|nr:hypothetical protein EDD21DRAFT_389125 [Dissophora ornata]
MILFALLLFCSLLLLVCCRAGCSCWQPDVMVLFVALCCYSQQTGDEPLEFRAVACRIPFITINIARVSDHGCWRSLDFFPKLVKLSVVHHNHLNAVYVAVLYRLCTNEHLVFGYFSPRHCITEIEYDDLSVFAEDLLEVLLALAVTENRRKWWSHFSLLRTVLREYRK